MSRASVLARGRAFLTAGLVDACRVERVASTDSNPLTGDVTTLWSTVYVGACRVQAAAATWAGPATIAEAQLNLAALQLQLPVVGSEDIRVDDRVTITASPNDVEMVGRVFHVVGTSHKTHATTRKLPLQEILG